MVQLAGKVESLGFSRCVRTDNESSQTADRVSGHLHKT